MKMISCFAENDNIKKIIYKTCIFSNYDVWSLLIFHKKCEKTLVFECKNLISKTRDYFLDTVYIYLK